ncbi:sulfur carrier protein ThiS adenylyltransferase [Geothermobacter ehrlichii]|uniref:Sulfur carrier protein ThiS adenylyltransferase n=1 Tax=Geothermobacter ehrlichii TaxID=213224 RepID=A0A5D3WJ36_9BACT|nr:sulfur carrier protein ThiS adenylyltransferase ThiF [Geothermobacter ehrlichii]TYO96378.1 sulfur carrier protein ThiS adenylyltransferase [Geothermobacter ehrlichii]
MKVFVNERPVDTEAASIFALRDQLKPDADIVIRNGFPVDSDAPLREGDRVVLIRRGEIPPAEELEALLVARHTPGVHERVKKACVGIAGVGGLGSAVAVALARLGVGRLILADFDIVEPSNLNRQQYFIDQLGLPKVQAMEQNLRRINPYVAIEGHQVRLTAKNVPQIFGQADVLVEAFDRADQKAMLLESFRLGCPGKPVVAASGMAGFGPANTVVTRRRGRTFYLVGDGTSAAGPGEGLMAPRVGVAAHHQANAVLRLLIGLDAEGEDA